MRQAAFARPIPSPTFSLAPPGNLTGTHSRIALLLGPEQSDQTRTQTRPAAQQLRFLFRGGGGVTSSAADIGFG